MYSFSFYYLGFILDSINCLVVLASCVCFVINSYFPIPMTLVEFPICLLLFIDYLLYFLGSLRKDIHVLQYTNILELITCLPILLILIFGEPTSNESLLYFIISLIQLIRVVRITRVRFLLGIYLFFYK